MVPQITLFNQKLQAESKPQWGFMLLNNAGTIYKEYVSPVLLWCNIVKGIQP